MASIRKRGNSYQVTVSNGYDINGKKILETATFTPDPKMTEHQRTKALEAFVFNFEQKVKNGKYLDGEKITFQEFAERWLKDYVEQHLEATTIEEYNFLLTIHIYPAIGHLKLSKVQPTAINALCNDMLKARKDGKSGGYSPTTIKRTHAVISSIYSTAVKWNVVLENPCERVSPPKQSRNTNDIKFFTLEQAEQFLIALDVKYDIPHKAHTRIDDTGKPYQVSDYTESWTLPLQYKVFFYMALFCGLRRGELIALLWKDIDFEKSTVDISKSTALVAGKMITKPPKTTSSIRTITIPQTVMELLKIHRKNQKELIIQLGDHWKGKRSAIEFTENYLFTQSDGKQMYASTPYSMFKTIIKRYNQIVANENDKLPDIPLHGLRHTSATLLISQNLDVRTVSGRLGHAQTSTTMNIYSHSLKKMDEKAADTMDNLFSGKTVVK